jgi:hypothetical protein
MSDLARDDVLQALHEQIGSDFGPVRPLAHPGRRAGWLIPLAVAVTVTAPVLGGGRPDLGGSGLVMTWGVTALQALVGMWVLRLALREAVPGRAVPPRLLTAAVAGACLVVVLITLSTNAVSPTDVPPGKGYQYWQECVIGPIVFASPLLLAAVMMAVRAFPTRPALTGALCGLSAGVLSDAGWRLSCGVSDPTHVLGSHGVAIAALACGGALLATLAERRRWARIRRSSHGDRATSEPPFKEGCLRVR